MATKKRKSASIAGPVPQSREAAASQLAKVGELRRVVERRKADAEDQLAEIGRKVEEAITPIEVELAGLETGLQTWCEANRDVLTKGKTKTAKFATGTVSWRQRPPKVSIRGLGDVIEKCKSLGLQKFIRIKEEINKDAMLDEPKTAEAIAGVKIGPACEDFVIEPAELEGGP